MRTAIVLILIAAILYAGHRLYRAFHLSKELQSKIEGGAVLLDVRTEKEYAAGHIKNAVNI